VTKSVIVALCAHAAHKAHGVMSTSSRTTGVCLSEEGTFCLPMGLMRCVAEALGDGGTAPAPAPPGRGVVTALASPAVAVAAVPAAVLVVAAARGVDGSDEPV
jgi:hypothetical protein